jgi:hypothetical protein
MISDDDEEGSQSNESDASSSEDSYSSENSDDDVSGVESSENESESSESGDANESGDEEMVEKLKKRKNSEELEIPKRDDKRQAVGAERPSVNANFPRAVPPYCVHFDVRSGATDHDIALFFSKELCMPILKYFILML